MAFDADPKREIEADLMDIKKQLRLYAITAQGDAANPPARKKVREWLEAGVGAIQYREKFSSDCDPIEFGRFLRAITKEYDALFIVNDDPHLALLLGADGCHLGQDDMNIEEARAIIGPDKIVGLSTHNRQQVIEAAGRGADYIGLGPIYPSSSKDPSHPQVDLRTLGALSQNLNLPIVAIGGINLTNIAELVRVGCSNVAIISGLSEPERCSQDVKAFLDILRSDDSASIL